MEEHAYAMTVDGTAVRGDGEPFEVVDPATEGVVALAPGCSELDLDRAVAAARRAATGWAHDLDARRAALAAAAAVIVAHRDRIAAVLTAEQGKPLRAAGAEVDILAATFAFYAGLEIPPAVLVDDTTGRVVLERRPVGVVAAITPWNFPLALAGYKVAAALLAGDTVVLKPSPYTPLSTLLLGELLSEILPAGVLNVVSGRDPLGALLVRHPDVRKVSFTGSVASGRKVALSAAESFKRVTLELGGNDAALLLDDIDVEQVVRSMFWAAFENNGQTCMAIKRVYAPRRHYDAVVDAFAARAAQVRVGDGRLPGVHLGPLQNSAQFERVRGLLQQAVGAGASVAFGGDRLGDRGFFLEPTIVAGAEAGMPLVDQEQFGPVLPILPYDDEDAAIAAINATEFGLAGSVWSADPDRSAAFAPRIEAGTVWVNSHLRLSDLQPYGGVKSSGIGLENGWEGYAAFTVPQIVHVPR